MTATTTRRYVNINNNQIFSSIKLFIKSSVFKAHCEVFVVSLGQQPYISYQNIASIKNIVDDEDVSFQFRTKANSQKCFQMCC